jgi:hypothetical protein
MRNKKNIENEAEVKHGRFVVDWQLDAPHPNGNNNQSGEVTFIDPPEYLGTMEDASATLLAK